MKFYGSGNLPPTTHVIELRIFLFAITNFLFCVKRETNHLSSTKMSSTVRQRKTEVQNKQSQSDSKNEEAKDFTSTLWPKPFRIGVFALFVCIVPAALFYYLEINAVYRKAILINLVMSILGFLLTVKLIPVVVPYVLKRNMFGFDINKRGSPAGEIKV